MINYNGYIVYEDGRVIGIRGKPLKPDIDKDGYYIVTLSINKKSKKIKLHRLVAMCYIDNPENKPHINHKNGIKSDNSVNNLEWCSAYENNKHAINNSLNRINGESNGRSKLKCSDVLLIRELYSIGGRSQRSLGNEFGVSKTTIRDIVNRKIWPSI